jgi:hypothetical protein
MRRDPNDVQSQCRLGLLSIALFSAIIFTGGCTPLIDEDEGAILPSEIPFERHAEISLRRGYIDAKRVEYYLFEPSFVPGDTDWFPSYDKFPGMPVQAMYVWKKPSGEPDFDQRPIIDRLPFQAEYSDFFEIVWVKPSGDYKTNDIKSRATLLRADFELEYSGAVLNCPLIGAEASLQQSSATVMARYRKLRLWYRNQSAFCITMEGSDALYSTDGLPQPKSVAQTVTGSRKEIRVIPAEVYTLQASTYSGADLVTGIAVPQNNIFRYGPGQNDYSPLSKVWKVTVPSDYKKGELSSYGDLFPIEDFVDPRIEETSPQVFHNASVVRFLDEGVNPDVE